MTYPKSAGLLGYRSLWVVPGAGRVYKANNNFVSGNQAYAPNAPTGQQKSLTFSAAPANLSTITVPDNPDIVFTFTYSGSPGAGIIPLVAGGGTAAQAATAAQVAMAAQLSDWTVTNPSAGVTLLVSKRKGLSFSLSTVGVTNITIATIASAFGIMVPVRHGKRIVFLPA